MKFRTTLLPAGKTATGIVVPDDVVAALGAGKKPAVHVTINGHTYRSSIAVMGGKFMVGVSAENRALAGVAAGDEVEVALSLDTKPREVNVPEDLMAALKKDKQANAFFESLSYSNKSRHILNIEGAKTEETRQRRIEKSLAMFREGKS